MKKHFLLLVMALMSLTGWAQTATLGDVAIGEYTYGGETLPDPVVENDKGAILDVNTHYTFVNNKAYSDADCTTEVALSALKADGTTKYYMKISGAGAYTGQQKGVWFLVKKAALTIAYDNTDGNLNRGYGEAQKDLTAAKFGDAAGWKWEDAANAATLLKGTHPTSYSTADNNVGANKPITFVGGKTADNYTVTYTGTLTIGAKNVGDAAEPATNKATISAFQGDVTYTGNPIVGVYTIKDGDNTLTAGTAPVLYTAEDEAENADHVEGTIKTPGTGDYYVSEVRNVNWDGTTVVENRPTITFQGNYTGTMAIPATKGFKVNPAPITVSVKDIEYTYDNANHKTLTGLDVLKFEYAGIVGADVDKAANIKKCFGGHAVVVKDGADAIDASEYVLTISGGTINTGATDPATTEAKNYKFETYLPGKMTIKQRTLTIKADPKSKALGAEDPENSYTIIDGTLLSSVDPAYADALSGITYTRQDGETVGSYDITPVFTTAKVTRTAGTTKTDVTANYAFKAATPAGQLTIGKGAIVVTLKDAEKFYGEADPTEFEYVVTGLQDGDEIGEVKTSRDKSAENPEAVKSYVITATVTNPNPAKYTSLTVVPGIFTIKKAQLEFTMATQSVKLNPTDAEKTAALKKELVTVTGIKKTTDKAADLYALTYKEGIAFNDNTTIADGVVATLTDEAWASYEIITGKNDAGEVTTTAKTISGKLIIGAGGAAAIAFTSSDGKPAAGGDPEVPSDYSLIKNNAGETVTATLVINPRNVREVPAGKKHTWAAQTWNTMVLPFEISVADLSKALGYAIVNRVDAANTTEGNVQFKLEMDKIPANEPFCVKTSQALPIMVGGEAQAITFTGVTIVDGGENPSIDAGMGYKFVGAYKTKTIDKTTPTYNFLRGDNAKWAHIGGTSANSWTVVPFDAYVELTEAAAARGVTFTFQELDGSFTAIKAIAADVNDEGAAKTGWYNLNGMKLQSAPAQKGVYIHNGKKVIVK